MNPDDAYERILALLYEAALDDTRWSAVSALIEEACGAVGNVLTVGERLRLHFNRLLYRGESRQDLAREYIEVYLPQDEGTPRLWQRRVGQLIHLPDLYSDRELRASVACNEGWGLCRGRNGLITYLDRRGSLRVVWAVCDPVGGDGWETTQVEFVKFLLPHVRQFVRVRQALSAADALRTDLLGLLDNDRIGVVQLDRFGRILEANAPALKILRRGDVLVDRVGVLDARLPADRSRLRKLVGHALPGLWGKPRVADR